MRRALARSSVVVALLWVACTTEEGPDPDGRGSLDSGGASGGNTSVQSAGTTSTPTGPDMGGETGDEGCDAYADPVEECGPGQRCDFASLTCVETEGAALLDEPCASTDACSPGLVCFDGYCAPPCDPLVDELACDDGLVCAATLAPFPGACLSPCDLILQDCPVPGQACNLEYDGNGAPITVCTANPGDAEEGQPCQLDGDCAERHLCLGSEFHAQPCIANAPACCSALCNDEQFCFGFELTCVLFEELANVGYCGI